MEGGSAIEYYAAFSGLAGIEYSMVKKIPCAADMSFKLILLQLSGVTLVDVVTNGQLIGFGFSRVFL